VQEIRWCAWYARWYAGYHCHIRFPCAIGDARIMYLRMSYVISPPVPLVEVRLHHQFWKNCSLLEKHRDAPNSPATKIISHRISSLSRSFTLSPAMCTSILIKAWVHGSGGELGLAKLVYSTSTHPVQMFPGRAGKLNAQHHAIEVHMELQIPFSHISVPILHPGRCWCVCLRLKAVPVPIRQAPCLLLI